VNTESKAIAHRLALADVFHGLEPSTLQAIARHAHLRPLKAGQVLWKQGSHAYELAFVWDGELEVVRRAEGRVTYRSVPMNGVIGFSNAIGRAVCTVDVVARTATRVVLLPGDVLRSLIPRHPEIAYRALEYMGALVGRLSDEVEMLHHRSLETRILVRLRELSARRKEIAITHLELAEQVAARRESVSRALKSLERRGIVTCRRGRIALAG
jgi:CRP/FNR family transcriptional regulator, anaerobic regulatory protein